MKALSLCSINALYFLSTIYVKCQNANQCFKHLIMIYLGSQTPNLLSVHYKNNLFSFCHCSRCLFQYCYFLFCSYSIRPILMIIQSISIFDLIVFFYTTKFLLKVHLFTHKFVLDLEPSVYFKGEVILLLQYVTTNSFYEYLFCSIHSSNSKSHLCVKLCRYYNLTRICF